VQRVFQIKICGITTVDDAEVVSRAGVDAVGLNFYPGSARWLDEETAAQIIAALPPDICKVGVFVNAPVEEICATYDRLGLDMIQLHGDEPPEFLPQLGSRPVIRAFRCGEEGPLPALEYLQACGRLGRVPDMVLMDAFRPGHYGGTGATINWLTLVDHHLYPDLPPLVLAGGLRAETVGEAIHIVGPAAVDTASGVERSPGHKDPRKVTAFVSAARRAFDARRLADERVQSSD
jgi:phosphoribosylanthranilate isomerase